MNLELTAIQLASVGNIDPLLQKAKLEVEIDEMLSRLEKMEKDQKEGQPEDSSLVVLREQIEHKKHTLSLLQ